MKVVVQNTKMVTVRTTIVISKAMDQNLELCRIKLGLSKNDIIKEALRQFMKKQGFDADRKPKTFDFSY